MFLEGYTSWGYVNEGIPIKALPVATQIGFDSRLCISMKTHVLGDYHASVCPGNQL